MYIKIFKDNPRTLPTDEDSGEDSHDMGEELVKIADISRIKLYQSEMWSEEHEEYRMQPACLIRVFNEWIVVANYTYEQLTNLVMTHRPPKNLPVKRENNV